MINQAVQQALSQCATDIMRDNIESVALVYVTKQGNVHSIYDIDKEANAFEFVGAVNILSQRVAIGTVMMPELGLDDDDEE